MSGDDQLLRLEGFDEDAEPTNDTPTTPVSESKQGPADPEPMVGVEVEPAPEQAPDRAEDPTETAHGDDPAQPPEARAYGEVQQQPSILGAQDPAAEPGPSVPESAAPEDAALDSSEQESAPAADIPTETARTATPRALYFLTNRMNLNGVLSSRLVAPRESHAKYYVDLLDQVPGWVPLLTQPPTPALIEAVTVERGAGTPVLIEFPLSVAAKTQLSAPVIYVPALALSEAVAIHFREGRDLREHRARGYKNVHPHDELLKVTPHLFAGDVSGEVVLAPPADPTQIDWQRIDRIRGAINGALASVQNGEQLAVAATYLGEAKVPASVSVPGWISWSEVDDQGAADARPALNLGVPDQVGFRAVYEVLGEQNTTDAWSPNAVLDSVASRIKNAGLEADAVERLIRNLQRVRSIVNVEVDFEPFRPTARALISAKALLLVLLRSDLEELLAWPDEQTGADDFTRVTAALLAGRLRGLARESTALRSLTLDDVSATWAVRIARGEAGALGKIQFTSNARGTSLKLDGVELATQEALLPDLVAKYQKAAKSKKEAVRIAVSRAVGWPVTHKVTLPEQATTTEDGGVLTILTPHIVELTISVDEDEFLSKLGALTGNDKRKALAAFDLRKK